MTLNRDMDFPAMILGFTINNFKSNDALRLNCISLCLIFRKTIKNTKHAHQM